MTAQNGRMMPVTLGQCMENHRKLAEQIQDQLDKRSGFYRWVIALIVAAILMLTGSSLASWASTRERLSALETVGGQREGRLQRIEDKLDRLLYMQTNASKDLKTEVNR